MLTGKTYDTKVSLSDYYKSAYEGSTLFKDLQEHNYDVRLYTDYAYLNGIDRENVNNIEGGQEYKISSERDFMEYLYKLVSFYAMPQQLKQYFWISSSDVSNFISVTEKDIDMYKIDDPQFYKEFMDSGIKNDNKRNVFVMYHLMGAHGPYTMNENCEGVEPAETSWEQQIRGAVKITFEFINQMKEMGIYDNSTIIITADHGGIQLYQNPTVLIKPKNVSQDFCKNSSPVTFENLRASIASSFLGDYSSYGKNLFDVKEEKVQRLHTAPHILGEAHFPDNEIVEANDYTRFIIPEQARDIQAVEVYDDEERNIVQYKMETILYCTTKEEWFQQIKTGMVKDASGAGTILGNSFSVTFELSDYHDNDILLQLEYGNVYNGKQSIEIYVNGEFLEKKECSQDNSNKTLSFVIPKEYARDNGLNIEMKFPGAARPSDFDSGSPDHRKLSISLVSMQLSERMGRYDLGKSY